MQLPASVVDRPLTAIAVGLTALVALGHPLVLGYWAHAEARAKGSSTFDVFLYMLFAVGVVHYWYVRFVRGDPGPRAAPPTRGERLAGTYAMAVNVAYLVSVTVSPPDPHTQVLYFLPLFAVSFALAYLVGSAGTERGPVAAD